MIYDGRDIAFPATMRISFFKTIETLETMSCDPEEAVANYARYLLKEVNKYPELREGIEDIELLRKHKKSIKKVCKLLFPEDLSNNEIKVLTPPFQFEALNTSARFEKIVRAAGGTFSYRMKDVDDDTYYLFCCRIILRSYFKYPVPGSGPLKLEIFNRDQGFRRVYKLLVNADMLEYIPTSTAMDITRHDFEELIDHWNDINLWKKRFPPNSWIMRGITIMNLVDVTSDQSIEAITANLLVKEADTYQNIKAGIHSLLSNTNLNIGLLSLVNDQLLPTSSTGFESILLKKGERLKMTDLSDHTRSKLLSRDAFVVPDLDIHHKTATDALLTRMATLEYKSFLLAPLIHENTLLGFMEIASPDRYELNQGTLSILKEIIPIVTVAFNRQMMEDRNHIQAVIQQECTTIHSSVKWKFEQAAEDFIEKTQEEKEQPVFNDITLKDVHPLYGQLDIKGSSTRRNKAAEKDLTKQIDILETVLELVSTKVKTAACTGFLVRLDHFKSELKGGPSAGIENKLKRFLTEEAHPLLNQLRRSDKQVKMSIDSYYSSLDPELNTIYERRKAFDTTINLINHRLASYLDDRQAEAQSMFPHYFERYKTDGVEFNLYIGQSIVQDKVFREEHLRNLRIWQLMIMCEMEKEFHKMQRDLSVPMEIASLILAYSTSISIHFRMDEKRFDVEGAYNARYEIVKKRIDKAMIKGTSERLTQPGHISIVYSQERDADEYRKYFSLLASKGYLKNKFDHYELGNLQGVTGLKALRVAVSYDLKKHSVGEILESFKDLPD
ncbi:MAG: GAF domain-containing protein [Roseivirga sp.]|nr:GAF domain-containing protein [Roseivirga sp.]